MAQRLDDKYMEKPEQVEKEVKIALNWLKGSITAKKLCRELNVSATFVYTWLSPRLRLAYKQGRLIIK